MPYYKIWDNETRAHRLVHADTKAQAINHVAAPVIQRRFSVEVARTAAVVELMATGVAAETAGKVPAPDQGSLDLPPPVPAHLDEPARAEELA